MKVVSTWMYSTPPGDKVMHYQVGADSDLQATQNVYWRCLFCLFESSQRLNGDIRHILFVNKPPPAEIDGIDTARLIRSFNIELVTLKHFTRPPKDYFAAWNTQFIVLDVLDWLAGNVAKEDVVIVLDSDCIFNRPIGNEFQSALRRHRALLYSIDYPPEQKINGLTRVELAALSREYDDSVVMDEFVYSGGEFICVIGSELDAIARLGRKTYEMSLDRAARGLQKYCEEAQLLSFVYRKFGFKTHTGNRFVKRIWTDRSAYSNVDGSESALTIWHLPAEKKRGFLRVFRAITKIDGKLRARDLDYGKIFGISLTPSRRIRDYMYQCGRPLYKGLKRILPVR